MKWLTRLCVAFLVAVFVACGSSPTVPPTAEEAQQQKESHQEWDCQIDARNHVRKILKHPLDAKFDPGLLSGPRVKRAGDKIVVVGTVIAKNDFGGELTHQYVVSYHVRDGADPEPLLVQLDGETAWANSTVLAQIVADKQAEDDKAAEAERARRELAAAEAKQKEEQRAAAEREASFRTWTDATGGFSVEARFVKRIMQTVTLEKRDGSTVDVPLGKLCEGDREFIANR